MCAARGARPHTGSAGGVTMLKKFATVCCATLVLGSLILPAHAQVSGGGGPPVTPGPEGPDTLPTPSPPVTPTPTPPIPPPPLPPGDSPSLHPPPSRPPVVVPPTPQGPSPGGQTLNQRNGPSTVAASTFASALALTSTVEGIATGVIESLGFAPFSGSVIFPSAQCRHTDHDGFRGRVNGVHFVGPSFDVDECSGVASGAYDLTKSFGLPSNRTFKIGGFVGGQATNVDLDGGGNGDNDSFFVGYYSLYTLNTFYLLSIGAFDTGQSDLSGATGVGNGDYDTDGFVAGGAVGNVFTLFGSGTPGRGTTFKADVRGGLSWSEHDGDSFTTGEGIRFGTSTFDVFSGSGSVTLFLERPLPSGAISKPYVKLGVKQWFDFENEVRIPAQNNFISSPKQVVHFSEDETFWNVEAGYLREMKKTSFQSSVFYDASGDTETVGGRIGMVFKLN